ncbi:Transfer origin protein, TraL, ATPase [Methylacidiphilum infernorum V4]|uniref:Transfer origin protein, TraL, ATPase n=2 Tax=Candidatus Methylacidiphilum infernorum TaxID=511746 RepID=B3DXC5_METI4|nr:Transfer origin protein, TraL, ATPase [Methylacidiphilum infernorum V4]
MVEQRCFFLMLKSYLFMTIGAKGGTGKTTAMLLIADWLLSKGKNVQIIEADLENSGKAGGISHWFEDCLRVDIRSARECDMILETAAENEYTLVDLPANSGAEIKGWWKELITPQVLTEMKVEVIAVGSVTPYPGSAGGIFDWAAVFQDSCRYLVAKNMMHSKLAHFSDYFDSKAGQQFRKSYLPIEIKISTLLQEAMQQLVKTGSRPSLLAHDNSVPILLRQRVKNWFQPVFDQLEDSRIFSHPFKGNIPVA